MTSSLVYVTYQARGIIIKQYGRSFSDKVPDDIAIACGPERKNIEARAVYAADKDVWIFKKRNGHLQATRRDLRQRKDYRYHSEWFAARSDIKFDGLLPLGDVLPATKRRVNRDPEASTEDAEFSLAAAAKIIDRTALRLGHPEHTRQNGTSCALNLRDKHLSLNENNTALTFSAKGVNVTIKDLAQEATNQLQNTPTVARNSYVHPKVIDLAGQGFAPFQPVKKSS